MHPGLASPLATESQSQSPRTSLSPAWPEDPTPDQPDALDLAPGWREQLSITGLWGSRWVLLLLPWAHQTTAGPCPSGTLGHTLYRPPCPHTQSLSRQLHFIILVKSPPTPKGGCSCEPSATRIRPDVPNRRGLAPSPRASDSFPAPQPSPSRQAPCIFSRRLGPRPLGPVAGWPPNFTCPRDHHHPLTSSVTPATLADWAPGPYSLPQGEAGEGRRRAQFRKARGTAGPGRSRQVS